jgi:hypothetical protein
MSEESKKKGNVDAELEALRQNSIVRNQRSQLNQGKRLRFMVAVSTTLV